jgi:molecular chaperone DnaJ
VQTCPTCQGEGRIITKACKACNGEGRQQEEDNVSLNIPAGVSEGMQLSMRGYGNAGLRGGESGDLLVQIEEEKHPHLVRESDNVLYELYINFADAALGTKVEVPTLTGKARFTVEPGTQSGKLVRLKGKGLPHLNAYGSGDQLVQINVWTPVQLNAQEKEALQKLQQSPNFQPAPDKEAKGFFDRMREFFN